MLLLCCITTIYLKYVSYLNRPCSALTGCKLSICCKFASSNYFRIFMFLCSSISVQPLVRCNANEELCVPTMPYHNADESVTDALSAKAESAALFLWLTASLWNHTCKTVSTVNGSRSVLYCITLSYCGCWCDLIVVFLLCRFYSSFSLQRFVLELCYSCSLRQMLWWYIKCSDKEPCFLLCSSTGGTTRLLIHDAWSELR